ncbi:DedA family protein [Georgenia alba]|uniref:DedA family protein n=2 Tax=Georgenia alba TaxID=2233858 RepID=A0ABW2QAT0_9MICO
MELMATIEGFVLSLGASPWVLVAVVVLATIDGFFPPVPSESIVIAVAVISVAGDGPSLWLLVPAAAIGAFAGDLIAYSIGSKIPVDDMRVFRGPRGSAALERAKRTLARRGTVFILSARFVPIGRVAVNMTAGAVGYPRPRFVIIAAIAAVVWAGYSTLMGVGAGHFLHEHPLVAVAVGVVGGVLAGILVDKLLGLVHRRWFPDVPPPEEEMQVADGPDGSDDGSGDDGGARPGSGQGGSSSADRGTGTPGRGGADGARPPRNGVDEPVGAAEL